MVREQKSAMNGEIVVAMIDGEATVKTFYKERGRVRLQPENDSMEPIYADNPTILGKVVALHASILDIACAMMQNESSHQENNRSASVVDALCFSTSFAVRHHIYPLIPFSGLHGECDVGTVLATKRPYVPKLDAP